MTDMTVAQEILRQLGGSRFIAMTGATHTYGEADRLTFALPGKPGFVKDGINHVEIILEPSDTYRVLFRRVSRREAKVVSEHNDIYAESLRQLFERVTGLATSLGTMGRMS